MDFLAFSFARMAETLDASAAGLGAAGFAAGAGVASSSSSGADPL